MNNVLLITGASRGIGAATALLAAERGYCVCVNYRQDRLGAETVVEAIRNGGGRALAVAADITHEADVVRLFHLCDNEFGPLCALVNNAGCLDRRARVETFDSARLQRIFATNVFGAMLCAREAVRRLSTRHGGIGGAIVNVSSGAARHGAPGEFVDYAAAKAAIDTFTVGLAREVADEGIRVNAVRPGFIDTTLHAATGESNRLDRAKQLVPMKRAGKPSEVAAAILWLLSPEASYTTGAILDIAGAK